MGLMDAINGEDRVQVKFTTFYAMMRESAKTDLMMNAVNCEVPYQYIREMVTGIKEEDPEEETPMDRLLDVICDILDDAIMNGKEEDNESVCGDDDTEEGDGSEGPEGGSGPEDRCDEDDGSGGTGLEN